MEKMELRAVNGVTVTGPTRISSNAGTFCWTSGPFVTIAEGDKGLENAEYVSVKVTVLTQGPPHSLFHKINEKNLKY